MYIAIILTLFQLYFCIPVDDPSQWPGHLEPFGSKQKTIDIEKQYYWPSAKDFFTEYVDKSRPILYKGVYRRSAAIRYWSDEYLVNNELSQQAIVKVEPNLKENRSSEPYKSIFRNFVEEYHKKSILMYSTVPNHLMKDVLLPPPLTCNETSKFLLNVVQVMSRGGSKSVVHNEDVETIYCALQGAVDILLIEYTQNKNYVINHPQGGYSTLDVDSVNYVKYPLLRNIDQYVKARLEEGDCIYIPVKWYKQMNGHANEYNRNIGLNVWFHHLHDHVPVDCQIPNDEATLDKFEYIDLTEDNKYNLEESKEKMEGKENDQEEKEKEEEEREMKEIEAEKWMIHFGKYIDYYKSRNVSFTKFYKVLKKDETISNQDHSGLEFPETFKVLAVELFKELDVNKDNYLTIEDFTFFANNKDKHDRLLQYLEYQTARIEDYIEDLVEAKHHEEPLHLFEERMKERFHLWRKFEL